MNHPSNIAIDYSDLIAGCWIHKTPALLELNVGQFLVSGKTDYVELDPYYLGDLNNVIEDIAFLMNLLHGASSFEFMASTLKDIINSLKDVSYIENEDEFYDKVKAKIAQNCIIELKRVDNEE